MKQKIRIITSVFFLLCTAMHCLGGGTPSSEYLQKYEKIMERTEWWRDARFGMFIHFGAYSIPARGEWIKSSEQMTTEEYQKYIDHFNPRDFDPKYWAKVAKNAGMKYAILTAKHHDGFCLFNSKYTDYQASKNFEGRDIVKEFLEAFRAEGLKVGLYYSLIDWHHPDYPNVGNHPMKGNEEWSKKEYHWDTYINYMHKQIEELVTDYGKIDIMWFDYSFGEYRGEKWKAQELVDMVRKHQPGIILNNRLELQEGGGKQKDREFTGYGDFETPEVIIPDEAVTDKYGNALPWETCLTTNNNWGYYVDDNGWKTPETIIHALVNCVSKNGNLLLNVGPNGRGKIPTEAVDLLEKVGKWVAKNGESIYHCQAADLNKPEWGRYTQNGNNIYAHWLNSHIGAINIPELNKKETLVSLLHDGSEVVPTTAYWGDKEGEDFFLNVRQPLFQTFALPDPLDTVFKITILP